MATVNEQLLSEAIRHAIALQHFSNGAVRRIVAILARSSIDIAADLASALSRLPPDSFTVQRLESLLGNIKTLNAQAYSRFAEALNKDVLDIARYEIGHQADLFASTIPPQIIVELPLGVINAEQVAAASLARPFQGRLLREWALSQEASAMSRLRDTVRRGYVEQQPIGQIVSRVRGTKAMRYEDGAMAIDRRQAEAVVRTAISHTAGYARNAFFSANEDLVKEVQWISTLDTRTSEPCILRDKLLYGAKEDHKPIGHSLPWGGGPGAFHWNCRSTAVPVLKSFRELGIDIPELDAGTRASIDGQVAGDLTYGGWLKRQSAAVQDDVLGPTRGALFRRGGMDLDRFANDKGRWLTLDELREKDQRAFQKSGL